MEINGKTYRNLESQVAYLTDVWNNQVALNEMGIKVVGHVDTEAEIPDGTYEYGDAYMVGTEVPYTMFVWTRADLSHTADYWFNVGKFPLPGPKGDKGDSAKISAIGTTSITTANYENQEGIVGIMSRTIAYDNGDEGDINESYTIPLTVNTNDFTIKPQTDSPRINLDLNHTKLATKYFAIPSEKKWTIVGTNGSGGIEYYAVKSDSDTKWSIVQRDANGGIVVGLVTTGLVRTDMMRGVYIDNKNATATMEIDKLCKTYVGNTYTELNKLDGSSNMLKVTYNNTTSVNTTLSKLFTDRTNPPMNILMIDEEVFNTTTYPNNKGILHLSNYQCPISGLHEYTYTTQIPGYYIVYKITDESNGQDTSDDLWSMNRSIYKMGTEVQPSEM